jgi:hypothetical protein
MPVSLIITQAEKLACELADFVAVLADVALPVEGVPQAVTTRAAAAARPRPADRPSRERGGKENAVVLAITGDSLP